MKTVQLTNSVLGFEVVLNPPPSYSYVIVYRDGVKKAHYKRHDNGVVYEDGIGWTTTLDARYLALWDDSTPGRREMKEYYNAVIEFCQKHLPCKGA